MKKGIIAGITLIVIGIGLLIFYEFGIRKDREANELLVEAKLIFERENKESINGAINIFSKIIAKYPETDAAVESYYLIARGYEKLGFNRQAYLKYVYLIKSGSVKDDALMSEIKTRIAHLKIQRVHTEEGVHQLLGLLNTTDDKELRSRIYSELGHTYLRINDTGKSKRMFDIALTEDGSNEEAILGKARAYKRMGQDDHAFDLYEYFLKYYGNFSQYTSDVRNSFLTQIYASGYNSYKRGNYWKAIGYFKRLLNYFPGDRKSENALYWLGESYFSLGQYENALAYFGSTLSNSYIHKDEDARMKRGYCYFMAKRFDLSAREFQIYMNSYPNGRFFKTARKWKEMSSKEIMYRTDSKSDMQDIEEEEDEDADDDFIESDKVKNKEKKNENPPREKNGGASYETKHEKKFENIAEI